MSVIQAVVTLLVGVAWPLVLGLIVFGFRADVRALFGALTAFIHRARELHVGRVRAVADRPLRDEGRRRP